MDKIKRIEMRPMTDSEVTEIKILLLKKIRQFIEELPGDHNLGWLPDNLDSNMTKAALTVLLSVNDTNIHLANEGHLIN